MNIQEVFKADASSVYETYLSHNGNCGFRIPIYQRNYDWKVENINRLFDDIINGLISLESDEATVTFLGTVLLVKDGDQKEHSFNGESLSIVDGQQRLTTLALIICSIQLKLDEVKNQIEEKNINLIDTKLWIIEEIDTLLDCLFECIMGSTKKRARGGTPYIYYPRIVRQIQDCRAGNGKDAEYQSLIAQYLFEFGKHIINQESNFTFSPKNKENANLEAFERNINTIEKLTNELKTGIILDEPLPQIEKLLTSSNFRKLFKHIDNKESHLQIIDHLQSSDDDILNGTIRLLIFGNYILDRVALTRVEAKDERYAFDIFEALNTTGEPLTAIETFKPRVIEFEEKQQEGYVNSVSDTCFKKVEDYLATFKKNDTRQAESKELVINFALYVTGEKVGSHLTIQRKYLRQKYEKIGNSATERRRFVSAFEDLVIYRNTFWNKNNIPSFLIGDPEKELIQFCLGFIKDMKNSLTIPILCRYYCYYLETQNSNLLKNSIKAITAFLIIRRAATGGTAGIDSDYRAIMSKGMKGCSNSNGLKLTNNYDNNVPDITEFRNILKSYLNIKKLGINGKKSWVNLVVSQPLYKPSTTLCKAMLLIASHNSISDPIQKGLIKKDRDNRQNHYMNWSCWEERAEFKTVEHVAPDAFDGGWNNDIYSNANVRHTIGNLSLLPEKENSKISNKPWTIKKLYYKAFSASTNDKLEEVILEAEKAGASFGPKTKEYLRSDSQRLPLIDNICEVDDWNQNIIELRSANIAELVWEEISPWLNLKD